MDEAEKKIDAQKKKGTGSGSKRSFKILTSALKLFEQSKTKIEDFPTENRTIINLTKEEEENRLCVDNISSLAALQESYFVLKASISMKEKNDETVQMLHQDIKEFLNKMPSRIIHSSNYEDLDEFDQGRLEKEIEFVWKKFRKTVTKTFYRVD